MDDAGFKYIVAFNVGYDLLFQSFTFVNGVVISCNYVESISHCNGVPFDEEITGSVNVEVVWLVVFGVN